jgi:hypothetical protein
LLTAIRQVGRRGVAGVCENALLRRNASVQPGNFNSGISVGSSMERSAREKRKRAGRRR